MGSTQSLFYVNYCDMQNAINSEKTIIHIMNVGDENILIKNTLTAQLEIERINNYLDSGKTDIDIYIYGYSNADFNKLLQRQKQLNRLGFKNVYVYFGGMFEWLLLREVYGQSEFPINGTDIGKVIDILKYHKPIKSYSFGGN